MRIKWANGRVLIDMDAELEAKPLLNWLQLIGIMSPHSVQQTLRSCLSNWHGQAYPKPPAGSLGTLGPDVVKK